MNKGFFGFLGGIIAGAATALLFAPKSGKEAREEVKKFIENAEDVVKKNLDFVIEEGKKQIDKLVSFANEQGKNVTEKVAGKKENKAQKKD